MVADPHTPRILLHSIKLKKIIYSIIHSREQENNSLKISIQQNYNNILQIRNVKKKNVGGPDERVIVAKAIGSGLTQDKKNKITGCEEK